MSSRLKLTIGQKIYAIVFLSFLGLLGATLLSMKDLASGLEHQKTLELRHLTEIALGIAKEEYAGVQKGTLTDAEARQRAAARIGSVRYGANDYFWINDMQPAMVMHPIQTALNGKNLSETKDPNGKRLFVEFVDIVKRQGGGVSAYEWPKPGMEAPQPKLAYVTGFAPWNWVIGTGVYIDDLHAQTWGAARRALLVTAVILLVVGVISVLIARGISRSMRGMTAAMGSLAAGQTDIAVPGGGRRDEIGDMAAAVNVFKQNAIEAIRLEKQVKEAERRAAEERRSEMLQMANAFQATVGNIVETVSSASSELESAAHTLTHSAQDTQRRSGVVASASEVSSANVQSVAAATDEMTASVNEISRQVQASSRIAQEAVAQAEKTDARINQLSQAAQRIGDVVKLITAVAEQTNLLALNATIEAARAGEAGRGFAVVASEVKALASQTAKATEEISVQVTNMQAATADSVGAIQEIGSTIGRISEIATVIAAAVEEQGAATQEIARNVDEAAKGTSLVASNISDVDRGAAETGIASGRVLASAQSLSEESSRLKSEVENFLTKVRAA